ETGDQRGLRIIDDRAGLAVEPAVAGVHLRLDGSETERRDPVLQKAVRGIENLSLPEKPAGRTRGQPRPDPPWRHDRRAGGFTHGNRTGGTGGKQRVQILRWNLQQLARSEGGGREVGSGSGRAQGK